MPINTYAPNVRAKKTIFMTVQIYSTLLKQGTNSLNLTALLFVHGMRKQFCETLFFMACL